jgi:hypothetical protein
MQLAEDNDQRLKGDDPRLSDPNTRNQDDAPTYIDFFIIRAKRSTFSSSWFMDGQVVNFTEPDYSDIREVAKLLSLLHAQFANIKLVNSIVIADNHLGGYALPGISAIVLAHEGLSWLCAIHEYGHTTGLEHRGTSGNPGDINDVTAIMHQYHRGGSEVNRFEQERLLSWDPSFWSD